MILSRLTTSTQGFCRSIPFHRDYWYSDDLVSLWRRDADELVATDLSPIQPGIAPPNVRFEIDDCCSEWVYPKNHFDYIHIRQLYASVADWPALYRECYKLVFASPLVVRMRLISFC